MNAEISYNKRSPIGELLLLLIMIFLAYVNTFHASWHLDDISNIVHNQNVHVSSLTFEDWAKSLRAPFSDPTEKSFDLYRPVAMLTFALNWYFGGTNVFGYHLINITIHCATAIFLFFTCSELLKAPNLKGRFQGHEYMVAFLAAALWALHPIQTQAVTYIVQRMASLAALFYIAGIYAFIKGRTSHAIGPKISLYGLSLFVFLLAMGSKQNAVTLPIALLLIELVFHSDFEFFRNGKGLWIIAAICTAFMILMCLIVYLYSDSLSANILTGYERRPFSMYERFITQFRVLCLYLFQIIYPIPQQFSIIHAIQFSTSLTSPWTTLPSMLGIGLLVVLSLGYMNRFRLLSFAGLFFFLGHSVESSILPLELVFEHRNYLPTLFIYLPVAAGIQSMLNQYRQRNAVIYYFLSAFAALLVVGFGFSTYSRNMVWASEKTLWQDALNKAPSLARPHQALAMALENEGRFNEAIFLYQKALTLDAPEPQYSRFNSLGNIGNILKKLKNYKEAVAYLTAATKIESGPYANRVRYNLALCLLNTGQEKKALEELKILISKEPRNPRYLTAKGFVLLQQGMADAALNNFRMALNRIPNDPNTLVCIGMALNAQGAFQRADWYLNLAKDNAPRNHVIHFCLLQNAIAMHDDKRIDKYLSDLSDLYSMPQLIAFLKESVRGIHFIREMFVPIDDTVILPYMNQYWEGIADRL